MLMNMYYLRGNLATLRPKIKDSPFYQVTAQAHTTCIKRSDFGHALKMKLSSTTSSSQQIHIYAFAYRQDYFLHGFS